MFGLTKGGLGWKGGLGLLVIIKGVFLNANANVYT